ncbi:hypothetical protein [Polyangium sp. y55x31]|uniref:SAP domain-containing protein n=1 Tax=Polyangium sp. y55x31 TaxID=3042688 RepID=UPI0024824E95|nr:hypothetical protein [Polyangium sp. y55x31]MDI1484348.1 hypothetical protein [Polyangium sp. y55x31]
MKLLDLLASSGTDELERLAHEHARTGDHLSRPHLLDTIESVLRSYRFQQEFLLNRQPPSFAILTLLLDAPEFALPMEGFSDAVQAETTRICGAIESGEVLKRDDQFRVYRRVLYQARSNDMRLDESELAILGVLRQELNVAQVEHFLIEHHPDLREFWHRDGAIERELRALSSAGIVFVRDSQALIPEDLAPVIRRVLGIDMSRSGAKRLFGHLSGQELRDALADIGAATSGSKDERIERLIAHMAQPRVVLRRVGLDTLRTTCRDVGAAVSGSKDNLVDRIVAHVGAGRDLVGEPEPEPVIAEPRRLDEVRFALLFGKLRGHEMAGILGEFNLRRWGGKDLQIRTLLESQRSETTLLGRLSNLELETVLRRVNLKPGGSKAERIERLLEHFATVNVDVLRAAAQAGSTPEPTVAPDLG